jgi:hypothetical protein
VVLQIIPMIILGVSIDVGLVTIEAGSSKLSERSPSAKGDECGFARVCPEWSRSFRFIKTWVAGGLSGT